MIGVMQNYKTLNSFCLVEPNKSVIHIHPIRLSLCTKAVAVYVSCLYS
jgi:hypothetical protein